MASIRTFIAVELPDDIKQEIGDFISQLRPQIRGVRWVEPLNLHLTMKFLGNVEEDSINKIVNGVSEVAQHHSHFIIQMENFGAFPGMKRPRVLWIGVKNGLNELSQLAASVENKMVKLGFELESRKFSPHLTVGRVRRGKRVYIPQDVPSFGPVEFDVTTVTVMKSTLTPEGPIYDPLRIANLSA